MFFMHLYLHIPWCLARCPYCDFNTFAARTWPEEAYADGLLRELDHHLDSTPWNGASLATIYFGGGTPSLFAPATIARLIDGIAARTSLLADAEITLEANPGTVDRQRLAGFRQAGVNRLSVGVQSFDDGRLAWLGRAHDAEAAKVALRAARQAGFDNLSLDLIHAVPGQDRAALLKDLDTALSFEPEHISAYSLTYEQGTPLTRDLAAGRVQRIDEEVEADLFETVRDHLGEHGYPAYEVSNHARAGYASRHNLAYWRGTPYLGLGAGAWSFAPAWPSASKDETSMSARHQVAAADQPTSPAPANNPTPGPSFGKRWRDLNDPRRWIEAVAGQGHAVDSAEVETLSREQAMGETCWLGLRQTSGLARSTFLSRFGEEPEAVFPLLVDLLETGLLETTNDGWCLTRRGLMVADAIFARFQS